MKMHEKKSLQMELHTTTLARNSPDSATTEKDAQLVDRRSKSAHKPSVAVTYAEKETA